MRALRSYERQVALHTDKLSNLTKYVQNWASLDARPQQGLLNQMVDPQAGQEIRFDPQRWQAVALDPVTRVETPLTIMAFRLVNAADVLYAATGFAPDRLLEVRFVPGLVRPEVAKPIPWIAVPVLGVPALFVSPG